jgi:hypothetical protein
MFYAEDKTRLRRANDGRFAGVRFRFNFSGSQVLVHRE